MISVITMNHVKGSRTWFECINGLENSGTHPQISERQKNIERKVK